MIMPQLLGRSGLFWVWVGLLFPKKHFLFVCGVAHPVTVATRAKTRLQGGEAFGTPNAQIHKQPKILKDFGFDERWSRAQESCAGIEAALAFSHSVSTYLLAEEN